MKALKLLAIAVVCSCSSVVSQAQIDSMRAQKALYFADSLMRSAFFEDWKSFENLSIYNAIKYYGGKEGFNEHVRMLYYHYVNTFEEKPQSVKMVTMMNNGTDEWQCVVEKIRNTFIENRACRVYSYLVGQSKDDGDNWKFMDVSHNSVKNVIFIFPEIFSMLAIPDGKTIYEEEEIAAQIAAEEAAKKAADAPKKKALAKKPK